MQQHLIHDIAAILIPIAAVIFCAGVCFLFFRLRYGVSKAGADNFLNRHRRFFTLAAKDRNVPLTRDAIKQAGAIGWKAMTLPSMGLLLDHYWTVWTFVFSLPICFLGGLLVAYGWYGVRCFRLLGVDSYN